MTAMSYQEAQHKVREDKSRHLRTRKVLKEKGNGEYLDLGSFQENRLKQMSDKKLHRSLKQL